MMNKQTQFQPDTRLRRPAYGNCRVAEAPNKPNFTVFQTPLGWFGLCGTEKGLLRTCLPCRTRDEVEGILLSGFGELEQGPTLFKAVEKQVIAYYEGKRVDFSQVPVNLDAYTPFQQAVLLVLKAVTYGKTVTYADLARLSGRPKAIRAVGTVMAANPLPLIIPCHRVLRSDGSLGNFSAPGGTDTKKHMLALEKAQNLT